jgi:hypothetical protein
MSDRSDSDVKREIERLSDNGAIIVAAASNQGHSYLGRDNIGDIANYEPVIAVGSLDSTNDNKSLAGHTSGVNIGRIDLYASDVNRHGGTSRSTAYAGATIANLIADGNIPSAYDVDGNGRFDGDEIKSFLNSPDMPEDNSLVSTQSALFMSLHSQGYTYDKDRNVFISSNGDEITPLALNIQDDPEGVQNKFNAFSNRQVTEDQDDLYKNISLRPLLGLYNSDTPVDGEDENAVSAINGFETGLLLEEIGFHWDENSNTWKKPIRNEDDGTVFMQEISLEEANRIGFGGMKREVRELRLRSLGFVDSADGLVLESSRRAVSAEELTDMSEQEFVSLVKESGGSGGTFAEVDPFEGDYRSYMLQESGLLLNQNGRWVPDIDTDNGGSLVNNGVNLSITDDDISKMTNDEFSTFVTENQLLADGYQYNIENKEWVGPNGNRLVAGDSVTLSDGQSHPIEASTGPHLINLINFGNNNGHSTGGSTGGNSGGGTQVFGGGGVPFSSIGTSGSGGGSSSSGNGSSAGSGNNNTTGLVPCGNDAQNDECTVCHLQVLAMNLLNWLVLIVVAVAAILFVNAGALYVFSPTNPGNISKAHKLFLSALIGLIIVLSAWLIINMVMSALYDNTTFGEWSTALCDGSSGSSGH